MLRLALKLGADPRAVTSPYDGTALIAAAHLGHAEVVAILIEAEHILKRAFEPYVTTKAHGTGLGLAIVKKMIEEHHGQIKIENNQTGGACITIVLPRETSTDKNNDFSVPAKKKSVRKAKVVSQQKIVKVA